MISREFRTQLSIPAVAARSTVEVQRQLCEWAKSFWFPASGPFEDEDGSLVFTMIARLPAN
jgi:hypothetical protein